VRGQFPVPNEGLRSSPRVLQRQFYSACCCHVSVRGLQRNVSEFAHVRNVDHRLNKK
jgi:hypothetical protein